MQLHSCCFRYIPRERNSAVQQRTNQQINTSTEVTGQFQSRVLRPLLALATEAPQEAQALIGIIREKLDALETLLDGDSPSSPCMDGGLAEDGVADGGRSELDEIGRNQRSRVREMMLLDIMSSDARPFSLQQLMRALEDGGFDDASAAVVSQLHRMKKVGIIEQPANGMYEITQEGLGHLRKLKTSFGALVKG